MLSDKEQKIEFKKEASQHPEKYYPTSALEKNGFHRAQCSKCSRYFWTVNDTKICGEPFCNEGFEVVNNNPTQNTLSFIGVWEKIVEVLEPRGYKPLKRYPVVARWNPTTDFTIASIAAFQPYVITGEVPPPAKKLLIPQFCLRFGDIENVGITGSHCTGFVMIGQHQFVSKDEWDQEQAFQDIYDFLVDGVGLDKREISIQEDAWAGGGSFGPCMEFFSRGVELFNQVYMMFQQTPKGPEPLKLKVLDMGLGQERVAWFSQGTSNMYEAIFPQVLKKLREITNIELDYDLYNRFSQYSAFLNIDEVENLEEAWKSVSEKIGVDVEEIKEKIIPMTGIYSIAEHTRSLLFAISDGMLPSNVGGGYNLRIILRRALSFIDRFNWDIDLADVCEMHAEELKGIFPGVSKNLKEVRAILNVEREKYFATKEKASKIVARLVKKDTITTEKLLELYDSNGIDPELIKQEAKKNGKNIIVPDNFFQLVISRHEKVKQIHATHKAIDVEISDLPATEKLYFEDYSVIENCAKVLRIKKIDYEIADADDSIKLDSTWACILDKSVAYPTSGGQMHDCGTINDIPFHDVLKVGQCTAHILTQSPNFKEGDEVTLKLDWDRRKILGQHHTATHIVNAACRELLGNHINQAGAKKTINKAHLDITHYDSLSPGKLREIEVRANEIVNRNIPLDNRFMSRADAEKTFGMRLYQGGAVPGQNIRVVEIPGVEVEACGGTHVNNTKEVEIIKTLSSQKIQDGIVRIEFTAGNASVLLINEYKKIKENLTVQLDTTPENLVVRGEELLTKWRNLNKSKKKGKYSEKDKVLTSTGGNAAHPLHDLSNFFNVPIKHLVLKIAKLIDEWKTMQKEIDQITGIVGEDNVKKLIEDASELGENKFIGKAYLYVDRNILDNLISNIKKLDKNIIILLLSENKAGFNFVTASGDNVKDVNLSTISKDFFAKVGGKGGGKPSQVQGFIPINDSTPSPEDLIGIFKNQLEL